MPCKLQPGGAGGSAAPAARIAAMMLVRYPLTAVPGALAHLGLDRWALRRTAGLRFWRLLGSSRGQAAGGWEPRRYGLFSVWESAAALEAFLAHSPVVARYRRRADEVWTVRLAPVRWHGAWGGIDPLADVAVPTAGDGGPWVVLTRATLRLRAVRPFQQAAEPITALLAEQPGLIAAIGLGEVPLVLQATLSVWEDLASVQRFAYGGGAHAGVIRRTRQEGWYREEFFARFQPLSSWGSWDGSDPVATTASGRRER